MRWPIAALALSLIVGCRPENATSSGPPGGTLPDIECDWRAEPEPRDALGALCELEFREITRLEGDPNGIIPQYPIMALRDGRYVTATYSHGQLALWASDGRFLDVMGNGPGQGPGEFTFAANFLQVEDDELLVFTSRGIVHRYSTTGRFLRTHPFHTGEEAYPPPPTAVPWSPPSVLWTGVWAWHFEETAYANWESLEGGSRSFCWPAPAASVCGRPNTIAMCFGDMRGRAPPWRIP